MPTRNVVLTDHQEALIDAVVRTGRYQNASEVLRHGLRRVEQGVAEVAAKLDALRRAAQIGMRVIEQGEARQFESDDDLMTHLDGVGEGAINRGARG